MIVDVLIPDPAHGLVEHSVYVKDSDVDALVRYAKTMGLEASVRHAVGYVNFFDAVRYINNQMDAKHVA